jgi:ribosomal protein S18 acetylase RimI-like enzyme/SAM-dependent methyltransferase
MDSKHRFVTHYLCHRNEQPAAPARAFEALSSRGDVTCLEDATSSVLVRPSPWDSDVLDRKSFVVECGFLADTAHAKRMVETVGNFLADQGAAFAIWRMAGNLSWLAPYLLPAGWALADRMTVFLDTPKAAPLTGVRAGSSDDDAGLASIAAGAFLHGRVQDDPDFPADIKEKYVRALTASVTRNRGALVSVDDSDRATGFVSGGISEFASQVTETREGVLGLIAVAAAQTGRGIGKNLYRAFMNRMREENAAAVEVATQNHNAAALSLYRRSGAREVGGIATFHWHRPELWTGAASTAGQTRCVARSLDDVRQEYEGASTASEAFQRAKWGSVASMFNAFRLGENIVPWTEIKDWRDIGCGEADFFSHMEAHGRTFRRLSGCDLSPTMIARTKAKRFKSPATFDVRAFQDMPATSDADRFDLVSAIGVLQQCGLPPSDAFAHFARMTRPGRYLFLTTKNAAWREFTSGRLLPEPNHSWFAPPDIKRAAEDAEFKVLRMEGFVPSENRIVGLEDSHSFFVLAQRGT